MSSNMLLYQDEIPVPPGPVALNGSSDDRVTLRLSGGKPMHMRAELLAECSSWSAGAPAWQDLALYRRDSNDFAVSIKTCRSGMGRGDVFHAQIFPSLDTALDWVQSFNPTADIDADIDSSDRRISAMEIALRAATLRQQADRVEQQYRVMIGELFYRLDIGE